MRQHITISLDIYNGEANLTPKSQAIIDEMIHEADLLDYDLLSDMHDIFQQAFDNMAANYHEKLEAAHRARLAKWKKENAA
jgi:hypothetical protein